MRRWSTILLPLSLAILVQGVLAQPAGPDQEAGPATGEAEVILPAPEWYAVIQRPGETETLSTRGDAIFSPENPGHSLTVREVGAHAIILEEVATAQMHTVLPGDTLPGLPGFRFLKAVALDHLIYRYQYVDRLPRPDARVVALEGVRAVLEVEVSRFLGDPVAVSAALESPLPTEWEPQTEPVHAAAIQALPGQSTFPYEDETLVIWGASSLEKIARSYDPERTSRGFRGRIELYAAQNEYESFQIAVTNKTRAPIKVTNIAVPDFISLDGSTAIIAKENITVFYVGYLNHLFPEVLFPATVPGYQEEFRDAIPGENLNLWITAYVPPGTQAGEYGTTVSIETGGRIFEVPVYLRVWAFVLPQRSHVRTHLFSIDKGEITERYNLGLFSEGYEQFIERMFDEYQRYRVSAGSPTPINLASFLEAVGDTSKWSEYFAEWCNRWLNVGLDCNDMQLARNLKRLRVESPPIYEVLRMNEWMANVYARLPVDEVLEGERAEENLLWAEEIKKLMPGVKRLHTFGGLHTGLRARHIEFYSGSVEIWCFFPEAYFENGDLKKALDERVIRGEELCWYIHNYLKMWRARRELRYYFWRMWSNRVSRIAFWRTTSWSNPPRFVSVEGKRIRIAENTTWRTNRGFISIPYFTLGDGVLFWPDTNRVLTSIRLAIVRDGIEDYEYWALAKEADIALRISRTRADDDAYMAERNVIAEEIEQKSRKF